MVQDRSVILINLIFLSTCTFCLHAKEVIVSSAVDPASPTIGICGATYTSESSLIWLTNDLFHCIDGKPCRYEIVAPDGYIVRLNFTRLSGLEFSESETDRTSYDVIDGQSSCQPRIEVSETYLGEEGLLSVERTKTLCYDRIFGSSVVIDTSSSRVVLAVFCLSRKYSFFSMNFSFTKKQGCLLQCQGICLQSNQICDGVVHCPAGEDELNCDSRVFNPQQSRSDKALSAQQVNILLVVLVSLSLLALILISTVLVCIYNKRRRFKHHTVLSTVGEEVPTDVWDDDNRALVNDLIQRSSLAENMRNNSPNCAQLKQDCCGASDRHGVDRPPGVPLRSYDGERGYTYEQRQIEHTNSYLRSFENDSWHVPQNARPFENNPKKVIRSQSDINIVDKTAGNM